MKAYDDHVAKWGEPYRCIGCISEDFDPCGATEIIEELRGRYAAVMTERDELFADYTQLHAAHIRLLRLVQEEKLNVNWDGSLVRAAK